MRGHGQSTVWGFHVGVDMPIGGLGWLRHLHRWFASHTARRRGATSFMSDAGWDARSERLRPFRAESALEQEVARRGVYGAVAIYTAIM